MRYVLAVLAVILAVALGWWIRDSADRLDPDAAAMRIQDQISRISRFATAEGLYSRMIRYSDEGQTTWFQFTDKRFLVRADARVVYGFALDSIQVDVERDSKSLVVRGWPSPTQLSFELDTEYFDIEKSVFATVEREDLNRADRLVRERMENVVDREALQRESYAQADVLLSILRDELAVAGWTLRIQDWPEITME